MYLFSEDIKSVFGFSSQLCDGWSGCLTDASFSHLLDKDIHGASPIELRRSNKLIHVKCLEQC